MIACQHLVEAYISTLKQGFKCLAAGRRLRIITPYTFPDNDFAEIFVEELGNGSVRVTDLGETFRHLHSQGFDVTASSKRRFLAETISSRLNVDIREGRIEKSGGAPNVGEILLDVILAVRGVADLIYTSKTYEPATFLQEVKDFLEQNHFSVEQRIKVPGSSGRRYSVDFRVLNGADSYVHTLSPASSQGMKGKVDATFRLWSDFNGSVRKFSVLNDIDFDWREPDRIILGRVSKLALWSEKDRLVDALQSA